MAGSENLAKTMNNKHNRQKICLALLLIAKDEKKIKQIACYYMLKRCFVNSRIYNYRSRIEEIANICGTSRKTIYNYFKVLRDLDLIWEDNTTLLLRSTKELKRSYNERKIFHITVSKDDGLKEVECRLMSKIIEDHARKVAIMESFSKFEKKQLRDKDKKWCRKGNRLNMASGENRFEPSLSIRTIAKLLNVGERKVMSLIQALNDMGLVKTQKQKPKLIRKGISAESVKFLDLSNCHHFVKKGNLFIQFGLRWSFLEHPIFIKQVTYEGYLNRYKWLKRQGCTM